jgi:hypothetical protein
MARDELFAGLCFLGCVNGLGGRVIQSVSRLGWTAALLDSFDTSAIVWCACVIGLLFLMREEPDVIRSGDLAAVAVSLLLIMLPTAAMSWLAVAGLSLYMLLLTNPPPARRRGAVILLAVTVPMLWSRLALHLFAGPILKLDASLVGRVLGTGHTENMVGFADGSGYMVIISGCSWLANTSLAFLCWVTINELARRQWHLRNLLWCAAVCTAMIGVNVIRLSLMGSSVGYYNAIHSPVGDSVVNLMVMTLAIGMSLFGARDELFSRA